VPAEAQLKSQAVSSGIRLTQAWLISLSKLPWQWHDDCITNLPSRPVSNLEGAQRVRQIALTRFPAFSSVSITARPVANSELRCYNAIRLLCVHR